VEWLELRFALIQRAGLAELAELAPAEKKSRKRAAKNAAPARAPTA
jgi:hypothetical protein